MKKKATDTEIHILIWRRMFMCTKTMHRVALQHGRGSQVEEVFQ